MFPGGKLARIYRGDNWQGIAATRGLAATSLPLSTWSIYVGGWRECADWEENLDPVSILRLSLQVL